MTSNRVDSDHDLELSLKMSDDHSVSQVYGESELIYAAKYCDYHINHTQITSGRIVDLGNGRGNASFVVEPARFSHFEKIKNAVDIIRIYVNSRKYGSVVSADFRSLQHRGFYERYDKYRNRSLDMFKYQDGPDVQGARSVNVGDVFAIRLLTPGAHTFSIAKVDKIDDQTISLCIKTV